MVGALTTQGSKRDDIGGTSSPNRFLTNDISTPNLVDLVDGAEAFGLLGNYNSATGKIEALDARSVFSSEFLANAAARGASAALLRVDRGPAGYSDDYVGYDMLLMVNLTGNDLYQPQLGVGNDLSPLMLGGATRDVAFGGAGDVVLDKLAPYQIYATLVPSSESRFQLGGAVTNNGPLEIEQATLANNQALYLQPDKGVVKVSQRLQPVGDTLGCVLGNPSLKLR